MNTKCTDKNIRSMLYAYELGLLEDDKRRTVELHLLECESCFRQVQEFEKSIQLLNHDPEIKRSVLENIETYYEPVREHRAFSLRGLIPAVSFAIIIIFVLILQPWNLFNRPGMELNAAGNRLAVLEFENLADPADTARLGEILANLVATDLSEDLKFDIVPDRHVRDVLERLKIGPNDDKDIRKAADKLGADQYLRGTILRSTPPLQVTTQIVDAHSGRVIYSQKIQGSDRDNIFSLTDKITMEILNDIKSPTGKRAETNRQIAVKTTASPEAYRFYIEGLDYEYKLFPTDALNSLEKALEYDSTFAMVYYHLTYYKTHDEQIELINKALKYGVNLDQKEKYLINYRAAEINGNILAAIEQLYLLSLSYPDDKEVLYKMGELEYSLRQYELARNHFLKSFELDPEYKITVNMLAYDYMRLSDTTNALAFADKYIALVPEEPNPYDTKGEICLTFGMIDQARKLYQTAIEKKPDYHNSLYVLSRIALLDGDYKLAREYCDRMAQLEVNPMFTIGQLGPALITLRQGNMQTTLNILDSMSAAIKAEIPRIRNYDLMTYISLLKSKILYELGNYDGAMEAYNQYMYYQPRSGRRADFRDRFFNISILAGQGKYKSALDILEPLRPILQSDQNLQKEYDFQLGLIELAGENYPEAAAHLKNCAHGGDDFGAFYYLGLAYLKNNQPQLAVNEFEKLNGLTYKWRVFNEIQAVNYLYYTAQAYDQLQRNDRAGDYYREFRNIWLDADSELLKYYKFTLP